ncbi:cytochrome c3 family protein [Piscinibacter koreensis]|uniref:Cytochrome c3 family protein n=1 Tax=Piscinibacter koreensis TaxID=2742824 RepID=A0A7Y6NSS4_9BURK|nr:cytochrome c3 family protein [Schlegelella koreensis]NUZ08512.1 cytochrome c3 family protein [Schlegelella koreensis]
MSSLKLCLALLGAIVIVIAVGIGVDWNRSESWSRGVWQQAVTPGSLSQSHAFLADQCVACHTAVKGVESPLCVTCHADNAALLQRQPTAFHADVQVCSGCHVEHQGTKRMPTTMDHSLLAEAGHELLRTARPGLQSSSADVDAATQLLNRLSRSGVQAAAPGAASAEVRQASAPQLSANHPRPSTGESMLNCVGCHATKDRHQGLLGTDCVQCHATTQWTLARFVHPSPRSTECSQCHKEPPSHNMMHFSMMSARIAGQPEAKVNQCFLCHQTTNWNDIKGVDRVKHH